MEIVLIGGNGYIGREVTRLLLAKSPEAHVTVVSRSGKNELRDPRLSNVAVNVSSADGLAAALPEKPDCMFCLAGGLGGEDANVGPVRTMLAAAEKLDVPVVGCVGGTLGDAEFTTAKVKACELVRGSGRRAVVVEPTLVYGAGRSDKLSKMVPLLKFAGAFNKKLSPVRVEDVATEIADGIVEQIAAARTAARAEAGA